jgi:Holliday junction resolvasome RuvABC DNA-binding subunit
MTKKLSIIVPCYFEEESVPLFYEAVEKIKDKLKKEQEIAVSTEEESSFQEAILEDEKVSEAVSALQVLGYSKKEIVQALEKVDMKSLSVEDIIRKGLGNLAKGV